MCVDVVRYTTCSHQRSHQAKKCKFARNAGCFGPLCDCLFGPVSTVPCTISRAPGKVDVVEGWCSQWCRTQFGGLDTTKFRGKSPGQYLRAKVAEMEKASGMSLDWFPYRSQSQMTFDARAMTKTAQGEGPQRYRCATPSGHSAQVGQPGHSGRVERIHKPEHVYKEERIDKTASTVRAARTPRAPGPAPLDRATTRPDKHQSASADAFQEHPKIPISAVFRDGRTVYHEPNVGAAVETAAPPDRPPSKNEPRREKATTSGEASRAHNTTPQVQGKRPEKNSAKPKGKARERASTGSSRKDKGGATRWPAGLIHRDVRETYTAAVAKGTVNPRGEPAAAAKADGERHKKEGRSLLPLPNRK